MEKNLHRNKASVYLLLLCCYASFSGKLIYFKQKSVTYRLIWVAYHHLNCKARIRTTDCILPNKDLLHNFNYFHVLTHFLGNFSIKMETIAENSIILLIYTQLQTVDITQILTALSNSMLVIPALLPEREPLGSHLSAQRKDKQKLEQWIRTEVDTKCPIIQVYSASHHTPKQKGLPPNTSQSLTLRSMPPVASNREPGLNCTAFTSPSCASWGGEGTEQPPKRELAHTHNPHIRKLQNLKATHNHSCASFSSKSEIQPQTETLLWLAVYRLQKGWSSCEEKGTWRKTAARTQQH